MTEIFIISILYQHYFAIKKLKKLDMETYKYIFKFYIINKVKIANYCQLNIKFNQRIDLIKS